MSEVAPTSTSSKKNLVNASTQHGNENTCDEENIVVLAQSFSPVRETSDEVVWHEDFVETPETKRDDDVS